LTLVLIVSLGLLVGLAAGAGTPVYAGLSLPMWAALGSFAVQWLGFGVAYWRQTEAWFDLLGSLNYIALVFLFLLLAPLAQERTLLVGCLVIVWAARLGSFLFLRIRAAGGDRRFDAIRSRFMPFLITWTLQALWVIATAGCVLAAMAVADSPPLSLLDGAGLALWVIGFALEVIADEQKHRFRRQPDNKGRFITSGLWSVCQHPNYLGEIMLWCGLALLALPALAGAQWLTLLSPLFVALLLLRISGVPLLQKAAIKRWGDDAGWRDYVASTPVLLPWVGRRWNLDD
jgi:steroid 5-alpha reductase family enzyme